MGLVVGGLGLLVAVVGEGEVLVVAGLDASKCGGLIVVRFSM